MTSQQLNIVVIGNVHKMIQSIIYMFVCISSLSQSVLTIGARRLIAST